MDTDSIRQRLQTIQNARLLFNTDEELMRHVRWTPGHHNQLKRIGGRNEFIVQAVYHELVYDCGERTGLDLDACLDNYYEAMQKIEEHLPTLRKHRKNVSALAEKLLEQMIFDTELPEYTATGYRQMGQWLGSVLYDTQAEMAALLLRMFLGILPLGMGSKGGDVESIEEEYKTVYRFFQQLAARNVLYEQIPAMSRLQQAIGNKKTEKTRIRLIGLAGEIIQSLVIFATKDNFVLQARADQANSLFTDLNGYWIDDDHHEGDYDFWEIVEMRNAYQLKHYHGFNAEKKVLEYAAYNLTFRQREQWVLASVQHPRSVRKWLAGKKLSEEDITYRTVLFDNPDRPTLIVFSPYAFTGSWFPVKSLRRMSAEQAENTKGLFDKGWSDVDSLDKYAYQFVTSIEAITHDAIYVKDEERDRYYKVPTQLYEGLEDCTLNDAIGIICLGSQRYLAFDELLFYIDITDDCQALEKGVSIMDRLPL
ncbi:MAG: hypothetical protein K6A82_01850 [Prevotella sp.]|nr:hypothetical protein [Prevotella sp.]